jgi:hypothetical protein
MVIGYSAGKYNMMDEESTGRMVIPPGPAHGRIHLRNIFPPGITVQALGRGIHPRNGDSINSSRTLIQAGKTKMREKTSNL